MKNKEVEQEHIKYQEKFNKELLEHGHPIDDFKFVAVGYLSIDEEFEKGEVSQNFLTKLKVVWEEGITLGSLGSHECEFCIDEGIFPRGRSSSEKELIDRENKIKYLFPEMIFHYITKHKYLPPSDFIRFVMEDII